MADYTYDDVPDQTDRIILITGANIGLGFALAADFINRTKCKKLILACRSQEKAQAAIQEMGSDPRLEFLELDLGDIEQTRKAAAVCRERYERIDTLVLNAASLNQTKVLTKSNFEQTIGVTHFGHFVFTAQLWPLLVRSKACRIVPVASVGHEWTKTGLDLEDLNWTTRKYDQFEAYFQSKLANVYFQKELARRVEAASLSHISVISLSPGYGRSGLYRDVNFFVKLVTPCVSQSCEKLSLNTLRAASDMQLKNGDYLNPKRMKFWGPPVISSTSELANDPAIAKAFWEKSEELVGEKFEVKAA